MSVNFSPVFRHLSRAGLLVFALIGGLHAANQTVTTLDDTVNAGDNVISLREAIAAANADDNDGDIITFGVSGTIMLTEGTLQIDDAVEIDGELNITIDGSMNNSARIFTLPNGAGNGLTLSNLTLANGSVDTGNDDSKGGSLFIGSGRSANLSIVAIRDSAAVGTAAEGGAIWNGGSLVMDRSSISDSVSGNEGGAVYQTANASTDLKNSTFSGNSAMSGGAFFVDFDATATGDFTASHITVSTNSAETLGGAITVAGDGTMGSSAVVNSIFGGNTITGDDGVCTDVAGTLQADFSILGNFCSEQTIQNEGSPTIVTHTFQQPRLNARVTHRLLNTDFHTVSSIPALDAADDTLCNATVAAFDQLADSRRPFNSTQSDQTDARCDVGAYERLDDSRLRLTAVPDNSATLVDIARGDSNVVMLEIQLTNPAAAAGSAIEVQSFIASLRGNGNFNTELGNFRVFKDINANGFDTGDTVVASGADIVIDTDNASVTVTLSAPEMIATDGGTLVLFLVADVTASSALTAMMAMPAFLMLPLLLRLRKVAVAALLLAGLTACGGGSSDDVPIRPDVDITTFQLTLRSITAVNSDSGEPVVLVELPEATDDNMNPDFVNAGNQQGPLLQIVEAAAATTP